MIYRSFIKPLFDFLFALIVLLLTLPILILISLLLFIANKGPIFFVQERPGKHGKIFKVLKFKTMNDSKDVNGKLKSDQERLTKVGRFVRKTSIDELPQMVNVLKGDMSIIGPRPLLVKYLPLYNEVQGRRHLVRPGITGWAQVNGRNAIGWKEKFEFDVFYVDNLSFKLDLFILVLTIKKVLISEGISSNNSATMEPFKGN